MKRATLSYTFKSEDIKTLKEKVLHFVQESSAFSILDNHQYEIAPSRFELLAGVNVFQTLNFENIDNTQDWVMGQFDFEFQPKYPQAEYYTSFVPETVIYIAKNSTVLIISSYRNPQETLTAILSQNEKEKEYESKARTQAKPVFEIDEHNYIKTVNQIRQDIFEGTYYELNYCVPFVYEVSQLNPLDLYLQQSQINPAPMSGFYRFQNQYIMCSSPERFLSKVDNIIRTQPIKGTSPKSADEEEDLKHKTAMKNSIKERAEHIMIVDLSRNDLAKCSRINTVSVPELFGIYSFPFVHQMISTIQGELLPGLTFSQIWSNTYPMGSMTGAPKNIVVQHIQKYEVQQRKAYSGSLFYKMPNGDFDSNVVIRSFEYDADLQQLAFKVGSAITYDSIADQEWLELQWKSKSMLSFFDTIKSKK